MIRKSQDIRILEVLLENNATIVSTLIAIDTINVVSKKIKSKPLKKKKDKKISW